MDTMITLRSLSLAVLSSVLLSLSLPNELYSWGNPALGLVALVPLYLALTMSPSYRAAFVTAAVFGGLAHGLSSYWLWFFKDFRFWTLGSSILAYMVVYGFVGMYLRGAVKRVGLLRPLMFAMVWTVFEWGKSSGFLGYPWGLLAYSWNTVPAAVQIAESTGVYGITFSLAFISAAVGDILSADTQRPTACHGSGNLGIVRYILPPRPDGNAGKLLALGQLVVALVLMAGIIGYGFVALQKPRMARGNLEAVLVQQNIDSWEGSEAENLSISIALARKAIAARGASPDLVIFSETTLRRPWNGFQRFYARTPPDYPLAQFISDSDSWLFTGAPEILDYDTFEATNSVILIDPQGTQRGSYAKMHPVPFAEAIPFWEHDSFRKFIQDVVGLESGWVMGSERILFKVPSGSAGTVTFAAPICFEDAFAYLCREFVNDGAEILVNLTNDSWSKTRSAEIQHFIAARFRSIELRRTLVRSTNGGVSAIVGPDGGILEILPLFESTSRHVEVPIYTDERTPYLDYGEWFVLVLACIIGIVAIILFIDDRKAGRERP
jgi:apolipoprotein N-acyltransferase